MMQAFVESKIHQNPSLVVKHKSFYSFPATQHILKKQVTLFLVFLPFHTFLLVQRKVPFLQTLQTIFPQLSTKCPKYPYDIIFKFFSTGHLKRQQMGTNLKHV